MIKAGHQPFDVPFPGSEGDFIEVIDIKDELPLGGGKPAKVQQVAVAIRDQVQTGGRRARQVRGHDRRSAAVEGKRADHHPAVANRKQLFHATFAAFDQQIDRVRAIGRWFPILLGFARLRHPARLFLWQALFDLQGMGLHRDCGFGQFWKTFDGSF